MDELKPKEVTPEEMSAMGYMFHKVIEQNLTYGQAVDKAIHEGKRVTRQIWKGYWELRMLEGITVPTLVAVLRGNAGVTIATPYAEDKMAKDWMVVE
jgi:hypothetical protein